MESTERFGIEKPEDSDVPDGPTQIGHIADRLEELAARAGAQSLALDIATEQARTNASFGLLGTPDEIPGVVVPAGGLLIVSYEALWKETVEQGARAAIFLDNEQLRVPVLTATSSAPEPEAGCFPEGGVEGRWAHLLTDSVGLVGTHPGASQSLVTTGVASGAIAHNLTGGTQRFGVSVAGEAIEVGTQVRGGLCVIRNLAAGTYDVSIRYATPGGGTVTVKDRSLRVWTQEFATP